MALEEGRFFTGSISDRRYNADGFAEYFRDIFTSGVWSLGDNLNIVPGSGMHVCINYGKALVDGYPYRLLNNDTGLKILPVAVADTQPRIDRVVIRKDVSAQRVYAYIKKGTPAVSPVPPALEQSKTIYEISLAQISVPTGISEITSGNLMDERKLIGLSETIKLSEHRVGSYYISDDSTSPAILFGGTWTRVKDVFLLAAGDIYAAGTTGGVANNTLTLSNLPGTVIARFSSMQMGGSCDTDNVSYTGGWANAALGDAGVVYGQPFSNIPPYLTVYIWKRTA